MVKFWRSNGTFQVLDGKIDFRSKIEQYGRHIRVHVKRF